MSKALFNELKKIEDIVPEYDETSTEILIPKTDSMLKGAYYLIEVEEYIIHPYEGFDLHDNWNNGIVPTDKQMNIEVIDIMGKMIKVFANGLNDKKVWEGWLPRKSIHILERY